jgi:hypothetical protein
MLVPPQLAVWWSSEFCAGQKFINIAQISAILFT